MNFQISRSGFCLHCEKAGRPHDEMKFLTFGSTTQQFCLRETEHDFAFMRKGFVPVLYEKIGQEQLPSGLFVKYKKTCGVIGCGIYQTFYEVKNAELLTWTQIKHSENDIEYKFYYRHRWTTGLMPVKDWNALVADFKDTGYELD